MRSNESLTIIDRQTAWYDYNLRLQCPTADYTAFGSDDFVNAKSQGFKFGTATNYQIDAADDPGVMTIADWHGLDESTTYNRCGSLQYHETDGGYHIVYYTHTGNSQNTARWHGGRRGAPWGVGTGSSVLEPRLATGGADNHGIADMMYMRWLLGKSDAFDWGLINMFDYLGFANSSDQQKSKSQRMSTTYGWGPPNNDMAYGRSWHWAIQCGHLWRNLLLGWGDSA